MPARSSWFHHGSQQLIGRIAAAIRLDGGPDLGLAGFLTSWSFLGHTFIGRSPWMAQNGTGWQLFRRSPSPISKTRKNLAPNRETGWYSCHRRRFGRSVRASLSGASPTTDRCAGGHKVPQNGYISQGQGRCPHQPCSSPPNGGADARPGHPDDQATRSASRARRGRPQARLRHGRSMELGITHSCTQSLSSFEDCTKVAKNAGSPRVHSSLPSCNLRERPRCLATIRYDRHNPEDRRNPLDQPSGNRFTCECRRR
jgi:hypothetical protein